MNDKTVHNMSPSEIHARFDCDMIVWAHKCRNCDLKKFPRIMKNNTGCELVGLEEESQIKLFLEKYYSNLWYFISQKKWQNICGRKTIQNFNNITMTIVILCLILRQIDTNLLHVVKKNYIRNNRQNNIWCEYYN